MSSENIFNIAPYDWASILTALFCGGLIGLERQLRGKPVGIRTSALITLGTYLFVATSFSLTDVIDQSRVIGQVITGIGFLGAGVMMARNGAVVGVTSAAAIWVLAALGVMVAAGYLFPAIKLSVLVIAILYGMEFLELHTKTLSRGVHSKFLGFTNGKKKGE